MSQKVIRVLSIAFVLLVPVLAVASVETTLETVQGRLVGTILPLVAILGFIFAGFSYITGNANARSHLFLAVIGAAVGFGASSIVRFIRSMIQ